MSVRVWLEVCAPWVAHCVTHWWCCHLAACVTLVVPSLSVLCSSPTLQLTADRVTELPRPEPPGVRGAGAGLSSPVITVSVTSSH